MPIEDIDVGDEVLVFDPTTGEEGPREVTDTITNDGHKTLVDITTTDTNGDTSTLTAPEEHPFWAPKTGQWIDATDLDPGTWLRTSAGTWTQVTATNVMSELVSGPLYPEPPHLIVAIYPSGTEEECFASLCQIAEDNECRPEGTVEVAPWDATFELRSDLAGQSTVVKTGPDRFRALVSADSDHGRAVRAGFQSRRFSTVVVEYVMAPGNAKHPIEFAMAAGPLGAPEDTWNKSNRSRSRKLIRFTTDLLRAAAERRCALYGSIVVESALPVPYELENRTETLGTEVFVSNDVLGSDPRLPEILATDFGEAADWPNGRRYSAWGLFTSSGSDVSGAEDPWQLASSSIAVGRAARIRESE